MIDEDVVWFAVKLVLASVVAYYIFGALPVWAFLFGWVWSVVDGEPRQKTRKRL